MSDIQTKITEAQQILVSLGFPNEQTNERSALTLLALAKLLPSSPWEDSVSHLIGVTPIMDFVRAHYGRSYAPNSRETFRRQTIHQFVQSGIALHNPDDPLRKTNSSKNVYALDNAFVQLLRLFGTERWSEGLLNWLNIQPALKERYAQIREMNKVPVKISQDRMIALSPGDHSVLIRSIIEEFAPRFAPGSSLLYVGDTGEKWAYFDEDLANRFEINPEYHGKMPDVMLYSESKDWFLIVESVTSHGPIDHKRRIELAQKFPGIQQKIVYITAFPTTQLMKKYAHLIAWETEVWVAEHPTHLIHFDGERFLGPY